MSALTHMQLRDLRAAILTAADRASAARDYLDAVAKAPMPERLLAHLLDAVTGRYDADERRRIEDAVDEAKAGRA